MLCRRLQCERVDRDLVLPKTQFQVAAIEERGELPVAATQVKNDREGLVLLSVSDKEVEKEALAALGEPEGKRRLLDIPGQVERTLVERERQQREANDEDDRAADQRRPPGGSRRE